MELLVATWTVRMAFFGALTVVAVSLASGSLLPEAVIRAAFAAFVFTLGGRLLIGFLETPEQRLNRIRRERAGTKGTTAKSGKAAKSQSTLERAA